MRKLVAVVLLVACSAIAFAQEQFNFQWFDGNTAIGTLNVKVQEDKGITIYAYESNLTANFGESLEVEDGSNVTYKNDTLIAASASRKFNGNSRVNVNETFTKDSKIRSVNGHDQLLSRSANPVAYVSLFVQSPKTSSKAYSVLFGADYSIRSNGENSFVVTDSKKRKHYFTYNKEGKLIKAVIDMNVGVYTLLPN